MLLTIHQIILNELFLNNIKTFLLEFYIKLLVDKTTYFDIRINILKK